MTVAFISKRQKLSKNAKNYFFPRTGETDLVKMFVSLAITVGKELRSISPQKPLDFCC